VVALTKITAASEIASSLCDIPVTIQAGNHGVLKQSNSISNHFEIVAPVAHRPRRAHRGLPTSAASRVLNLGNRCWIFFKHAKNRAAGQKNSRFADQFAKYCRHVCCAFEHREVAAGGERSPRTMSRTKVFRMAMGRIDLAQSRKGKETLSFRPQGEIFLRSLGSLRDARRQLVTLRSWRLGAMLDFGFRT
jgi:hypothetical protein